MSNIYENGIPIVFVLTFIVSYIYAIATYGFLLGVSLGWIPALITAGFIAFIWPLLAVAIAGLITAAFLI